MSRPAKRPDRATLVAGIVLVVLGTILLLDRSGVLTLTFGSATPLALGAVGAILLASGLARGE